MTTLTMPLTNGAYWRRTSKPVVLAVVHITDNRTNQGPTAALNERNYANRAGSQGPSAHYYVNRDGSSIMAIDPVWYVAWSNGDVNEPHGANAGVAKLAALRAQGVNANRGCYLEIECVGYDAPAGQWTDAQFATVARLIRDAAKVTGLPINRDTVLPHAWINSVNRPNCPFLAPTLDRQMDRLIALAKEQGTMSDTEQTRLAKAIRTIADKYLPAEIEAHDKTAIAQWSLRIVDYATRLANTAVPTVRIAAKPAAPDAASVDAIKVEWVNVPWPQPSDATVDAILSAHGKSRSEVIDPSFVKELDTDENRILSAAGLFGNPVQPVDGADYGLFSGVVGENVGPTTIRYHVFRDGREITSRDGDGSVDTVGLWNEVA